MPSIAVVIPVYNGALTIAKSIKSLENQTFKDWVTIIVNDGSTDNTKEIIEALDNKKYIKIHLERNRGRGFARQTALNKIRELKIPYMCMLDADDWYFPNKLEVQFHYMEKNPDITLMSTSMAVIDKDMNIYKVNKIYQNWEVFNCTDYTNFIKLPHAPSIIRIKDIESINYNTNYRFSEDLDFLRRILFGKKYAFCPDVLYCYNRDNSFSFKKYYKSTQVDLDSYNNLPVSSFQKIKFKLFSWIKCCIVFILSIFGFEKVYLRRVGVKPSDTEIVSYLNLKKSILEGE